jgi:hypothetical protein
VLGEGLGDEEGEAEELGAGDADGAEEGDAGGGCWARATPGATDAATSETSKQERKRAARSIGGAAL